MTMRAGRTFAIMSCIAALASCTRTPATPSPAPGTGTGRPPAAPPPAQPPAGQPGTPPAGGPRARPSRDSLAKLRAMYVAQVMKQIAGHESDPADQVFKNVQVLKGITAEQLVHKMDKDFG